MPYQPMTAIIKTAVVALAGRVNSAIGAASALSLMRNCMRILERLVSYIANAVNLVVDTGSTHQIMFEVAARSESFSCFRSNVPGLDR